MADYCQQCSIELFGQDSKDFADDRNESLVRTVMTVVCEGCGFALVDKDGKCVGGHCLKSHKEIPIPFFGNGNA